MNSDYIPGQTVVLVPPTNLTAPVQSPTSGYVIGTVLSTTNGAWDQSPDSFRYQWRRDSADIAGQTSSSYTIAVADHGTAISCRVWASNAAGESATFASTTATAALDLLPTNTAAPVLSPTSGIVLTTVLSVTTGTWTNSASTYRYQWQRGGVDISGETTSSHTIVAADHNAAIRCQVWATNSIGESAAATNSNATGTLNLTPANSVVPVISGTGTVGQTLTVTNTGTWSNSPSSFTYQWKRGGVDIGSATSSSYVLVTADGGTTVTCAVTAINSSGTGGTATSNGIAVAAVGGLGTFTNGSTGAGTSSATSGAVTYPSGAAIYAIGVGYNGVGSTPGTPTISSSPTLTWTQVATCSITSGTRRFIFTMWRATGTGASTTVTINSAPNSSETLVRTAYVTGATTNIANAISGSGTTSPMAVTLPNAPLSTSYVFAACALTGSLSITGPSGFTQVGTLFDNSNMDISFYVDTTSPGTGVSFSRTGTNLIGDIAVEIKAA